MIIYSSTFNERGIIILNKLQFFFNFLKDKNIAYFVPTSKWGINSILNPVNFTKDAVFIEYGPGTGVITKNIINRMTANSTLILIEKNYTFYSYLRDNIHNSNVYIFHDCVTNIKLILEKQNISNIDYIISGIPFSFLHEKQKTTLMRDTYSILNSKGKFIIYQCTSHMKNKLSETFSLIKSSMVLRNFPPLYIFETMK